MSAKFVSILGSFLISAGTVSAPLPLETDLKAAFQAALTKTEGVPIAAAQAAQADYKLDQVGGAVLPTLSFVGTYLRQDTEGLFTSLGSSSVALNPNQTNARINLVQPLFRGLAEYAGIRQFRAIKRAREAASEQSRIGIFASVAGSYYELLAAQHDVTNLESLGELTKKRITEVRDRVRIGRSRKGELLSADAQMATLEASLDAARAAAHEAREKLLLITGLSSDTVLADDTTETVPDVAPLATFLSRIEKRPELQAKSELAVASDEAVSVAWGGHLPSLDLTGNYYLKRMGLLSNGKWDVGITLTIPLFAGGVVQGKVHEAAEVHKEAELDLAKSRRAAEIEIRSLHARLSGAVAQIKSFKAALMAAEANYKEQNKDYRFGLVTNLEVLQALNTLQETQRSFDRVRYQAKANYAQLEAAVGHIP